MRPSFVPVVLVTLVLSACGYTLVGRGSNIPEDVRHVYLQPLENRTTRIQVEQFLSEAIANELVTRQRFALVATRDEADAVLEGRVNSFSVAPVTFNEDGRANAFEVSITAGVSFSRVEAEDALWENDNYVFREVFEIDVSQVNLFEVESAAIQDSSERFAEAMVTDLLEGF